MNFTKVSLTLLAGTTSAQLFCSGATCTDAAGNSVDAAGNITGTSGTGSVGSSIPTACTRRFIDCSNRGGYDLSDPCRQTCNNQSGATGSTLACLQDSTCVVDALGNIIDSSGTDSGSTIPPACSRRFVDCSTRGGYDLSDPCRQTCNDQSGATGSTLACLQDSTCVQDALGNVIYTRGTGSDGTTIPPACTTQFVDCSNRGGYDLSDPCRHTCNDDNVTGTSGFPVGSGVNPATGTGTTTGGWPVGSGVNPATGTSTTTGGWPAGSGVNPAAGTGTTTGGRPVGSAPTGTSPIASGWPVGSSAPAACTKKFVDCSNRGGYDLSDPCRHTCNDDDDNGTNDINRPGGCCQLSKTDNFCAWFEYKNFRCKKLNRRRIGCNKGHWNPRAIYNRRTFKCEEPAAPEVGCCQISATNNNCAYKEYPLGECVKITVAGDISCKNGLWNPNASLSGGKCVPK